MPSGGLYFANSMKRKKRAYNKKETAPKATKALTEKIKKVIHRNVEKKYLDVDETGSVIPVTANSTTYNTGQSIANMSQGTSESSRVGNHVLPLSLDIRLTVWNTDADIVAGAQPNPYIRFTVFQYRDTNAAGQNINEYLLEDVGYTESPLNFRYKHLFNIIHDSYFQLPALYPYAPVSDAGVSMASTVGLTKTIKKRFSLKKLKKISWDGNTMLDGMIYFVISASSIATVPLFQLYTRFIYEDI